MDTVFLDGQYVPRSEARLSVDDRGFLFGDAVYEVIPAYGGSFLRMGAHLDRFRRGLTSLRIEHDPSGMDVVARQLIERNGLSEAPAAIAYFQVSRGAAPRAHHFPPTGTSPTVYGFAAPFQRPEPAAWEAGFPAITHPDQRWARVDIKTVQLLGNVLAQEAARAAGGADAILVRDGIALEGGHSNLFVVFGQTIRTHPASHQILSGITRSLVLELAREGGYAVEEAPTPVESLADASEVFLTGSTTEVRPIVRIDDRPVGNGRVGPVTRALFEAFLESVARECTGRARAPA